MGDDMNEIAFHEAGHAVVLRHFGISLACVRICGPRGRMPGGGSTKPDPNGPHVHLNGENQALVCLAGFAAECEYRQRAGEPPKGWNEFKENDRYYCDRRCARKAVEPCLSPEEDDDGEYQDGLIKRELARAQQLIAKPAYWQAVIELANKLIATRTVDGTTAMMIIDAQLEGR